MTPSPHFILPSRYFDLYPAPDGTVWVTNPGRHRLENYRSDGSLVSSWGQVGMQLERFAGCCNPAHIAVFPNARFATAEKGLIRIKEYDQQGQFAGLICGREKLKNDGSGLDLVSLTNDSLAVLDPEAGVIRIFERKPKIGTRASESFR